jgi:hypothetical protein
VVFVDRHARLAAALAGELHRESGGGAIAPGMVFGLLAGRRAAGHPLLPLAQAAA